MSSILTVRGLTKVYDGGFEALKGVDLEIEEGEVLALLGPNGAGKTTLISTICGLVSPSSGTVEVGGHDIVEDYRAARSLIGLVPQEINLEPFAKLIDTVEFTRGLFGLGRDAGVVETVLRQLSLWDKKDSRIMALSGGMKRRVLIAKALSHQPRILFLDEPTAGVDVELRKDMWDVVAELKKTGVTIILTTHYIEEAEAIADRVGVINDGRILLVKPKDELMSQMGRKELRIELHSAIETLPPSLESYALEVTDDGMSVVYSYDKSAARTGITQLLSDLSEAGLRMKDVSTRQSSLEDIFVDLVGENA